MKVRLIRNSLTPFEDLVGVLDEVHRIGPINSGILESIPVLVASTRSIIDNMIAWKRYEKSIMSPEIA